MKEKTRLVIMFVGGAVYASLWWLFAVITDDWAVLPLTLAVVATLFLIGGVGIFITEAFDG